VASILWAAGSSFKNGYRRKTGVSVRVSVGTSRSRHTGSIGLIRRNGVQWNCWDVGAWLTDFGFVSGSRGGTIALDGQRQLPNFGLIGGEREGRAMTGQLLVQKEYIIRQ
jgi:hypothetical protein